MVNEVEKILMQIKTVEEKLQQSILDEQKKSEKDIKKAKIKAISIIEKGKEEVDKKIEEKFGIFVNKLNEEKKLRLKEFEKKASSVLETSEKNRDKALDLLYSKFMEKMM